jgi:hypothetical protein
MTTGEPDAGKARLSGSGRGRRKRTRTTGTSPAAYFTTGARWGLDGAEAVLRLRALHANGDLDAYWDYHLRREHNRVHAAKYHEHTAPT